MAHLPRPALLLALLPILTACNGADNHLTLFDPATPAPVVKQDNTYMARNCPKAEIASDGAVLRVMAGAEVRHQFSLTDVVRECRLVGNQLQITVGLSGRIVLGPKGAAGAYTAPIRVAVVTGMEDTIVAQRETRINTVVTSDRSEMPFTLVLDPITVPLRRPEADLDYNVIVRLGGK